MLLTWRRDGGQRVRGTHWGGEAVFANEESNTLISHNHPAGSRALSHRQTLLDTHTGPITAQDLMDQSQHRT